MLRSQTACPPRAQRDKPASGKGRLLLGVLLLAGLTGLAYLPALHGGFIWDDNRYLTLNPLMKAPDGLRRIWLSAASPDYWPLSLTSVWLEWRFWAMQAAGYHATNVLLHVAEAFLLWAVLKRLGVPGAYLAALFFALHPVNVESVAWITQRKNLVAMLFFLVSILCFLKTNPGVPPGSPPRAGWGRWYVLSLLAFVLAMLGKGSVAPLPFVLLGIIGWRRRLEARDWLQTAPFFAVALIFTCVNLWFQSHEYIHFRTAGFVERMLAAGAVAWFYAGKAIWPMKLCFVYPQWSIHSGDFRGWIPLLAASAVTAWLFRVGRRDGSRWGRGALFAWLYFCVMLVPVMGFTDVGFMEFSLVADHYQHLAIIAVATLAGAGLVSGIGCLRSALRPAGWTTCALMVGLLGLLTVGQSRIFADVLKLYAATLELNPDCWMVHMNFADALAANPVRLPEAVAHYQEALRIKPGQPEAHYNLAVALEKMPGRLPEAEAHYEEALRLKPNYAEAHNNLGAELAKTPGRLPEALSHYERALRLKPDFAQAHYNLAVALAGLPGRMPEAVSHYQEALRIDPHFAEAEHNLANALATLPGRRPEAVAHYEAALRLDPNSAEIHENFGSALAELPGRLSEALAHLQESVRLNPEVARAHYNLALALMRFPGRMPEAVSHYREALRLKPDYAEAHYNLGNALASVPGQLPEALAHYEAALRINPDNAQVQNNAAVLYARSGRFAEAAAHWESALKLDPSLTEARENLNELRANGK